MLKILCPTDFSANAEYAAEYGVHLANALNAGLVLIASYKVPVVTGALRSLDEKIQEALTDDLRYFAGKYKPLITTGIEPETVVVQGNTSVSILDYARKSGIDLIVMGTKGSSSMANVFMGSITRKFFQSSTIPVLAIPFASRQSFDGNRILLALDSHGIGNQHSIALLREMKKMPGVSVDVIHVSKDGEKIKFNANTGMLAGIVDEIIEIPGSDPVMEIKHFVDNNNVGILAMVGRKHSFLERLFFETHSVSELFVSNIPVLLLPD